MDYRQIRTISGKGPGAGQFTRTLRGISLDGQGMIHAVGDTEVKVLDPQGELLRRWETGKPGYGVAVDAEGVTFVGQEGQVENYDRSGNLTTTWRDGDRLGLITDIGFHGDHVLLADAKSRTIHRYDRQGRWINDIGKGGRLRGFMIPNGHVDFQVDAKGIIHAVNPAKFRVERYTLSGELLGHIGKFGSREPEDFSGCCNPTNVALTPEGHTVVTEKAGPRVKILDRTGKLVTIVSADAFDPNCKNMDVAVDAQGRIYVADTVRLHICVFAPDQPEPDRPDPPTPNGERVP